MKSFIVGKNDANQRTDKFLFKIYPKIPKSIIYKAFRKKDIKVNRKNAAFDCILKENDVVDVYVCDDILNQYAKKPHSLTDLPINIIYEDDNILIIDKPKGLASQADIKNKDCVVLRMISYLIKTNQFNPNSENSFSPSICNRLDINTRGLLIAAKNSAALKEVNLLLKNSKIDKVYECLIEGVISPDCGTLCGYIVKDHKNNKSYVCDKPIKNSKKIVTVYKTLKVTNGNSCLEVLLKTGRSHQIRAQFGSMGHPLVGDIKYGSSHRPPYNLISKSLTFHVDSPTLLSYLNNKTFSLKI